MYWHHVMEHRKYWIDGGKTTELWLPIVHELSFQLEGQQLRETSRNKLCGSSVVDKVTG